jgi:GTPase Era involved in 16S rRNA processing
MKKYKTIRRGSNIKLVKTCHQQTTDYIIVFKDTPYVSDSTRKNMEEFMKTKAIHEYNDLKFFYTNRKTAISRFNLSILKYS